MANSKRFPGKFTGAKARLFVQTCEHYSRVVENAGEETSEEHPIFSWLSPHQRLQLVREVMVGLLCPDEPLPPETIQHYTTYLALVATIRRGIEFEIYSAEQDSINDDLPLDGYDNNNDTADDDTADDDTTDDDKIQTPEERRRNWDLICRQAEKSKEKIDRSLAGTDTRLVEEFQAPAPNRLDAAQKLSSSMSVLFAGPPVSAEARRLHRPLTETEKQTFSWRFRVDAALQENINWVVGWPLCNIDFDWRCRSRKKWVLAIDLLMITYHSADITPSEQALVEGRISELDYADWSRHARIHTIEKIVKDLRDSYDSVWKADMLAADQRAIFAVCSSQLGGDFAWLTAFMAACMEQGVDFFAGGDYQKRLEIYRRMPPLYNEGLSMSFHNRFDHFQSAKIPADFKRDDLIIIMCHTVACRSRLKEAVKLCSRCKIVSYCSEECQAKDWPDHKNHCKVLAELRKDKAKLSAIFNKESAIYKKYEEDSQGGRLRDYF
jgi:hypothetical protein